MLLTGCSWVLVEKPAEAETEPDPYESVMRAIDYVNYASEWVGSDEVKDNKELTILLGIDPSVTPWCTAFMNSVLSTYHYKVTGNLLARSYLSWGIPVKEPIFGDIVVFERGNEGWEGHVGIFIREIDDQYEILGGNQNNMVSYELYDKSRVLGIRRSPLPILQLTLHSSDE